MICSALRMAITIQVASPAQCDQVALEVGRLGLFARYGMDGDALARQLRGAPARGEQVLVACDGEQPIGFAWFLERGTLSVGGYLRLIGGSGLAIQAGGGGAFARGRTARGRTKPRPLPSGQPLQPIGA